MRSANSSLFSVTEQLQDNYSSSQLAETLDDLLFKFLDLLLKNTTILEYTLVELLVHICTNSRRKFSNVEVNDLQDTMFSFIVCEEKNLKTLREMRLERTIYFKLLEDFEAIARVYLDEVASSLKGKTRSPKIAEIEKNYMSSNKNFYSVCAGTLFWSKRIYAFRNMIVEKYIRLARVEANKAALQTGLTISKDDLTRGLIISIFKAINKYDVQKGPLTGYIKIWFMDAKTNHSYHEDGVAYTIPSQARQKLLNSGTVNIYEPICENTENIIEEDTLIDTIEREQDHIVIGNISNRADSYKVFALLNNLRYTITADDRQALAETMG